MLTMRRKKKEISLLFFDTITKFDIFISNIVIVEIEQADDKKRELLEGQLSKHKPTVLEMDEEIKRRL